MAVDGAGSCWDLSRRRPCTPPLFPGLLRMQNPSRLLRHLTLLCRPGGFIVLGVEAPAVGSADSPSPCPRRLVPCPACSFRLLPHARGCHGLGSVHPTQECCPTRTGNSSSSPSVGSPRCPRLRQGPSKVQPCPSFLSLLSGLRETTEVAGSHPLPHAMDAPHGRPARVLGPPLPGLPEDVQDLRARETGSGTVTTSAS